MPINMPINTYIYAYITFINTFIYTYKMDCEYIHRLYRFNIYTFFIRTICMIVCVFIRLIMNPCLLEIIDFNLLETGCIEIYDFWQ